MGAAIGAQLGFARTLGGPQYNITAPADMKRLQLKPNFDWKPEANRQWSAPMTPLIDVAVTAYLASNGRLTPEDFGRVFATDEGVASPVFAWDMLHTSQELLSEGMNPRLVGYGNVPSGHITAAMPAIGLFHAGDPVLAYLDGVEIASTTAPRLGADWAGLSAALIAAAFVPGATPKGMVKTVLELAREFCGDFFYELDTPFKWGAVNDEGSFLARWLANGATLGNPALKGYWDPDPIGQLLPVMWLYGDSPTELMGVLTGPPQSTCEVSAVIAGAALGALHGLEGLPAEWREWGEPLAARWMPLETVARARLQGAGIVAGTVSQLEELLPEGETLLFDKVYGCLLAGAIGNAMGSPVEGAFWWEVDEKYPGGIQGILDPSRLESEDDNQMAMHLVETYIDCDRPIMARDFGKTWRDRLNRDHFFVNCMGHCYDLIKAGWDPRITGHWTQVTGSTVMCMEPVGLFNAGDPEAAFYEARCISYMYQRGLDNLAASLLAAGVARAMHPGATVADVCNTILRFAPKEPLQVFYKTRFNSAYDYLEECFDIATRYDDPLAARPELYEKCLMYHHIDPLELFGLSLAMLLISKGDVRQAAIGGANIGRDADTTCGRAAMFAGTLSGAGNVPAEWVKLFSPGSLARLETNSHKLAEVILKRAETLRMQAALLD